MLPNSIAKIPRRLVPIIRKTFEKVLSDALHDRHSPEEEIVAFRRVFLFPAVLFTPNGMETIINACERKCKLIMQGNWTSFTLNSLARISRSRVDHDNRTQHRRIQRAVAQCVEAGNLRKGMERAINTDLLVRGTNEILKKLQAKHPTREEAGQLPTPHYTIRAPPMNLDKDSVRMAVAMAARCVKHGLDKLRMRTLILGKGGEGLLKLCTELCNKIVNNNLDSCLLPYIRDAEIVAAPKGDNDVHP